MRGEKKVKDASPKHLLVFTTNILGTRKTIHNWGKYRTVLHVLYRYIKRTSRLNRSLTSVRGLLLLTVQVKL